MTNEEVIVAQRKHYAEAIEKCARLAEADGLKYLADSIRAIGQTYGIETIQLVSRELKVKSKVLVSDDKVFMNEDLNCIDGYRHHRYNEQKICIRCHTSESKLNRAARRLQWRAS